MKLEGWNSDDVLGLEKFYASGCVWTISEMKSSSGKYASRAVEWVQSSPTPKEYPVLLPRVVEPNGIYWYAIAFSEAQSEQLRGDLTAFVGSAGTDFTGRGVVLDQSDEWESELLDWAGGQWVYRLRVYKQCNATVTKALQRMRSVWTQKPQLKSTLLRTTEALIREFFLSLANGNELNAGRILKELKDCGRLSAENVVFLEIEKLAAFGRWGAIAAHPQLSYLKMMRRPRHITELLVESLWKTELSSFADDGAVEGILEYYKTHLRGRYSVLLRSSGNSENDSVLMAFLLAAVGDENPRYSQIPKLLARLKSSRYFKFSKKLVARVKPVEASPEAVKLSPFESAKRAYQSDDFDTAWEQLLLIKSTTVDSMRLMLDCVEEIDTPDPALIVKQKFEELEEANRISVLGIKRHQRQWDYVLKQTTVESQCLPCNWEEWLESIAENKLGTDCLLRVARESVDWDVEAYLKSPERVVLLSNKLTSTLENYYVLQLSFPHLVSFFLKDGVGAREFLPIYSSLVEVLAYGDSFSTEDWNTIEKLLAGSVEAGLSKKQYADLLECLNMLWGSHGSIVHLDWALDVLELLTMHAILDSEALNSFYSSILSRVTIDCRRLRLDQWEMFRLLSGDLGFSSDYEAIKLNDLETSSSDSSVDFSGKFIAIYTLT